MPRTFLWMALLTVTITGSMTEAQEFQITLSPAEGGRAIAAAVATARQHPAVPVQIRLQAGTYYLDQPLVFTAADARPANAPLTLEAAGDAPVTLSAGRRIHAQWTPYQRGIFQTPVPADAAFDQLFVNGQLQHLARYPNYDPSARPFHGSSPHAIDPARVRTWKNPVGGFVHALHGASWGSYSYLITGVNPDGTLQLEGGWQNNRPGKMSAKYRMVEGIFEELDAPGEWYLDRTAHILYFMPPKGVDLDRAVIEVSGFDQAVDFAGSQKHPVTHITLRHLRIMHTARTFMKTREPLLRSDWRIYRGGAVTIVGGQDITIDGCTFDHVGGNAVFVSDYNRRIVVEHGLIDGAGASGVCFVGSVSAVRNPLLSYGQSLSYDQIDKTPGPKTPDYPADCRVEDCLIHDIGRVEKQVAGVEIDMAARITVSHCSIYNCPRAGINIGDGCWGGDVIEYCDVFNTVLETGDNGSFNSWGRDRYWHLRQAPAEDLPALARLDTVEPNTIRNSRWRCDHGWDIDLDDGSSNYRIYNNICLHGGIKNREGYYRIVENNIMVDCTFYPQVWFVHSQDVFAHNIVAQAYRPALMYHWSKGIDDNLLPDPASLAQSHKWGVDQHSIAGQPRFVDPSRGDYRVQHDSPALKIGFKNFPMNEFGVTSPGLRALAQTPALPDAGPAPKSGPAQPAVSWRGATLKKLTGLGEQSATGMDSQRGVLIVSAPSGSEAYALGLRRGDVILSCAGQPTNTPAAVAQAWARALQSRKPVPLEIWRRQQQTTLTLNPRSPSR